MAFELVTKSYSLNKSKQYRLSIREHSDGFSFSLVDKEALCCVALCRVDSKQSADLLGHSLLNSDFSDVTVVLDNSVCSFVPESLFNREHAVDFLALNAQQQKRALISDMNDREYGVVGICNYRGGLELPERFTNVVYCHPLSIMLDRAKGQMRKMFFVDIQKNMAHLLVVDYKRLILANTVEIHTVNDAVYYLLLTFQSLDLDVEKVPLVVSGNIDEELLQVLRQYIRVVQVASPRSDTMWSEELDGRVYPQFSLLL